MSTIDLERLIVRQKYFVPVKASELMDRILAELRASHKEIRGIASWGIADRHKNYCHFDYSMHYSFVRDAVMGKAGKENFNTLVMQKSTEFKEGLPQSFWNHLEKVRHSLPAKVFVFVTNIEDKGCTCDVECLLPYMQNSTHGF